ncbi:unannotated protein [freshwater metagenome]|uniref:Unannotated protein n=1 Tax=freshwater metagenome TaxID=449393 RepID=A0A6J7FHM5_9ZZZZ|nr:hypothetical protein [Actinomycetota bacterium]
MSLPSMTSRAWLIAALDQAGSRLSKLEDAGATNLEASWPVGDVTLTAKQHGDGVTITTKAADGSEPVPPMKLLAGWTKS